MKEIIKKLIKTNKTIGAMESCTGGFITNSITNVNNASKALKFSAVTYSSESKIKMGVNKKTIEDYTVYSENVANEMSYNISKLSKSNYGIGITGQLNDVNEVYISIYNQDKNEYFNEKIKVLGNNREEKKLEVLKIVIKMLKNIV